ncbi:unnamed protein product [marine sediment metagenome]|uniref:DUF4202 family protein n=1 Tax=marine sediment metagenome TaxID=412755 RepID=X1FLP2_9ZZZZ
MDEIIAGLKKKIMEIIEKSSNPEDPIHARNTLEWMIKLEPQADEALKIAALGHDIERAISKRKIKCENYTNYEEFKKAHSLNSAEVLSKLMETFKVKKELREEIFYLVNHHETGGNKRANLLKNADSLSFLQVNLPYYFIRNDLDETKKRCKWGYRRLPVNLRKIVSRFSYNDKRITLLVKKLPQYLKEDN